jgi:predicted RNA-binding protein YlqC (UPF0109 family)
MTPPDSINGSPPAADDDDEVLVGPGADDRAVSRPSGEGAAADRPAGDRPAGDRPGGGRGRGGPGRGRGGGGRGPGGPGGSRDGGPRDGGPRFDRNAPRVSLAPLTKLVAHLAKALVDRPDEVEVREAQGDRFPRIELTVAQEDIGKVIGKDGRTAQCIRALLQAAAARAGVRAHLDIVD